MKSSSTIFKLFLSLVFAISISSCGSDDPPLPPPDAGTNDDITRGLIAFFPFNGNANDESGNNKDGAVTGATLANDKAGNVDSAYLFNGTSDFIQIPVNINPSVLPQMTMTVWARADNDLRSMTVLSHDNIDFDRTIDTDNRGGGVGWSAFSGTGAVLGFEPIVVGEWVFIAVAYNQNAKTVKLYVNNSKFEKEGDLGEGWDFMQIGKNPSFDAFFEGAIDQVRIYDRALSESEIQLLINKFNQ